MNIGSVDDLPLANSGELLATVNEYTVWQDERHRWLQDGNAIQSIMDRKFPSKLVLPTHHAMFCSVAALEQGKSVLNLGCGPGAIERTLSYNASHLDCTSVDTSKKILDLAREYFLLPKEHTYVISSAEEFVASSTNKYDIAMVDLFTNGAMAQCVYDPIFYKDIASRLEINGIVALNLIPKSQNNLLQVLLPLRKYFPNVWLSEIDNRSNIVLLATKDRDFDCNRLISEGKPSAEDFRAELIAASKKFLRLPAA